MAARAWSSAACTYLGEERTPHIARDALKSDEDHPTREAGAESAYRQRDRMPNDATMHPKPTARFQYDHDSTGHCCEDR